MKIRPLIVLLAAIAAVLVVLVIRLGMSRPAAKLLSKEAESNTLSIAVDLAKSRARQQTARPASHADSRAPTNSVAITEEALAGMSKEEKMLHILSNYNHVPIVFYGKLQDQFDSPVAGASIDFEVRVWSGYESTVNRGQVLTDNNGLFTIQGYKGESLNVNPKKTGYSLASTNIGWIYSQLWPEDERARPDPNNPVVIKMWKLQGAERLISFDLQTNVPIDGTPVAFDLDTGRSVSTGGDILIRVESSLEPNIRDHYNWRFALRANSGGIIECSRIGLDKMFQAPDSGYHSEFAMEYHQGARPWAANFSGGFYFTSRNGRCYGKCTLQISTYRVANGTVPITIRGYINPAGSRNLEIDPGLVTQAHP